MNKKYKLDKEDTVIVEGKKLYRIVALIDIGEHVKAGDKGGFVEREWNLSHFGTAWIFDKAMVYGDAKVGDDAKIYGNAKVFGKAQVYEKAEVGEDAQVYGRSYLCDNAKVFGSAEVFNEALVYENAKINDNAKVFGKAEVYGKVKINDNANVFGSAKIYGNAVVFGNAEVCGNTWIDGNARIGGDAEVCKDSDYFYVHSFGINGRTTTFFRTKTTWLVICGCFLGTIKEFRQRVKDTRGDSLIAQEYLMIADLMEFRIKRVEQEANNE